MTEQPATAGGDPSSAAAPNPEGAPRSRGVAVGVLLVLLIGFAWIATRDDSARVSVASPRVPPTPAPELTTTLPASTTAVPAPTTAAPQAVPASTTAVPAPTTAAPASTTSAAPTPPAVGDTDIDDPQCNDIVEPIPPPRFTDVSSLRQEAALAVGWAAAAGLIVDGGEFRPREQMSRGAVATVLWRYFCEPAPTRSGSYGDVDPAAFYATAADWAAEQGLITGTSAGTFGPDEALTRAQFVTIAWRAAGRPGAARSAPFTDTEADAFYSEALDWAFSTGLVTGTSTASFDPDGILDRLTSIVLFYRFELRVDPESGF